MKIYSQQDLKQWTTFGVSAYAEKAVEITSKAEFLEVLEKKGDEPFFILGGGSNVLFTENWQGWLLRNTIKGKEILEDLGAEVLVEVGAGENWHEFVLWTLRQGLQGLENLSLIPGTVGAAPIQNIGAYGVELRDVFESLEAIDIETGALKRFDKEGCEFGYRDSIFKRLLKGKVFILKVVLRLSKKGQVNTAYGAIQKTLAAQQISSPSPADVSKAVIAIRSNKLPDPKELGNAGSFFKNPVIDQGLFERIQKSHPDVVSYPAADNKIKLPAGWLIERCGWKGKRVGNTGCYKHQSLVIVNYGEATGAEIWAHAQNVRASVNNEFGILLEPEVNIIGN